MRRQALVRARSTIELGRSTACSPAGFCCRVRKRSLPDLCVAERRGQKPANTSTSEHVNEPYISECSCSVHAYRQLKRDCQCLLSRARSCYRPRCSQCGLHSIVQLAHDDLTHSVQHAHDICRVQALALVHEVS